MKEEVKPLIVEYETEQGRYNITGFPDDSNWRKIYLVTNGEVFGTYEIPEEAKFINVKVAEQ